MTRSFFAVVVLGVASLALAPALLEGCSQTGVGDPCVPEAEYTATFNGFNPGEVNTESKSFQCQTRLCLVNHFQGRVSCPYGQTSAGGAPGGGTAKDINGNLIPGCGIPGAVPTGNPPVFKLDPGQPDNTAIYGGSAKAGDAVVQPQCSARTADKAVYCSCRCANVDGNTNDGAAYCKCPSGFSCTQLVTSIGAGDTGLTGGYCQKDNTDYKTADCPASQDIDAPVAVSACDATQANCGSYNGQ